MKRALLALLLAGCGATDPGGPATGPMINGIPFQGHTYLLTQSTDWSSAEAIAVSYGGHLAAVGDQAEQDFLTATFCQAALPLWIGATDINHSGTYAWSSGEPLSYTNWSSGEPNKWTRDEDYAAMNWHFAEGGGVRGQWNDAPLDGTTGYPGTTNGPYQGVVEIP